MQNSARKLTVAAINRSSMFNTSSSSGAPSKIQPPTVPEKGPSNPTNIQYRSFHTETPASKPTVAETSKDVDARAESVPIGEYFDKLQAGAAAKKPRRKVVEDAEREPMDFGDCGHPPNMMQGFAGMGSH